MSIFAQPRKQWKSELKNRTWQELRDIDFPHILHAQHVTSMYAWLEHVFRNHHHEYDTDARKLAHMITNAAFWPTEKWDGVFLYLYNPPRKNAHMALDLRIYEQKSLVVGAWLASSLNPRAFPEDFSLDDQKIGRLLSVFSAQGGPGFDVCMALAPNPQKALGQALKYYRKNLPECAWSFIGSRPKTNITIFHGDVQEKQPQYCQQLLDSFAVHLLMVGGIRTNIAAKAVNFLAKHTISKLLGGQNMTFDAKDVCATFDQIIQNNAIYFSEDNWVTCHKFYKHAMKKDPSLSTNMPFIKSRIEKKMMAQEIATQELPKPTSPRKRM